MSYYAAVPEFQTGDILSASRLNAMANNVDYVIGMDEQRVYPVEAGANISLCGVYGRPSQAYASGTRVEFWMLHNGDRLTFYHGVTGQSCTATLTYDVGGTNQVFTASEFTSSTFTLSGNIARYQPVRIVVTANNELFVRYLYQWSSNAPQPGSMPAFTNGGISDAADFNAVILGTSRAREFLNQPIACVYAHKPPYDDIARVGTRNGAYFYIRHKHPKIYFDVRVTTNNFVSGDFAFLRYNNVQVWGTSTAFFDGLVEASVPSGLTVGNWYLLQVGYQRSAEWEQYLHIYSLYEAPSSAGSTIAQVDRWEHGDTANGSAGTPNLATMSTAIDSLGTLRWTNQPCRQAGSIVLGSLCDGSEIVDQMSAHRVHQWLAYENYVKKDGTRMPAQISYATGTRTFAGVSMPTVTTPSFFNLETIPLKPGMFFRVSGVKFAIQAPTPQGVVV